MMLFDVNLKYVYDKNFSLNFAVKNLFDKKYFHNTSNRISGMNNFYGDPRNFMLTFDYKY